VEPKSHTEHKEADSNLSSILGENYEYIRTIVSNSIEIKKLELLDQSSNWIGKIIVGICLSVVLLLLSIVLLVLFAFGVNLYFENWLVTLAVLAIILFIKALFIHFVVRKMLYRKINQKLLSVVDTKSTNKRIK